MNGWPEATTGIIGALVGALVAWLLGRGKAQAEPIMMHAEATEAITDSAVSMLTSMQREIDRLAGRVTSLETKLSEAECRIVELTEERDELLERIKRLENGTTAPPHAPQEAPGAPTGP